MRCRSVLALLCGMSVLAIAGCTENPAASHPSQTTTPTTATPTPSGTPRPQPPVMPAQAKAKTKAGVEAFVRHWMATSDYLAKTGDSHSFAALNTTSCEWCAELVKGDEQLYAAGGYRSGDLDAEVTTFHLTKVTNNGRASVQYRADLPAYLEAPRSGMSPTPNKSAVIDYTLNLVQVDGQWKVDTAVWRTVREGE
jgi:hypothetical protein